MVLFMVGVFFEHLVFIFFSLWHLYNIVPLYLSSILSLYFSFSLFGIIICVGDLKRICETELGLISQCCLTKHVFRMSKQYLANVALKINVKVG